MNQGRGVLTSFYLPRLLGFICALSLLFSVAFKTEANESDIRLAPGDDKRNYQSADYTTDSLGLQHRSGRTTSLFNFVTQPQLGLPKLLTPKDNAPNTARISLGRKLFYDRRLSKNRTMSCAMCHIPEQGFTNNESARPVGFEGRGLKRNAPTILNAAFYDKLFVDGREANLEQQVWSPLLAANEMNNPSIGFVIDTITSAPDYQGLFEAAFGDKPNILNIGQAIAQYERALITGDSRFDRWYFGEQPSALSETEISGFKLFTGKAACASCHTINQEDALFSDMQLHNTGMGYQDSMLSDETEIEVQLAPGVFTKIPSTQVASVGEKKPNDLGRYEVTLNPVDRWKFRTPILRNVSLTAPYMHNGDLANLEDVISFYNQGGIKHDLISPLIRPLNLSEQEQSDLVAFLKSLTSEAVRELVADAFEAPIGDTQ